MSSSFSACLRKSFYASTFAVSFSIRNMNSFMSCTTKLISCCVSHAMTTAQFLSTLNIPLSVPKLNASRCAKNQVLFLFYCDLNTLSFNYLLHCAVSFNAMILLFFFRMNILALGYKFHVEISVLR